ncbi:uncharacterized protein E0L32_000170 [Thyridium curvatum]|uniref:MHD domain-containing protein n=1 Tax=Thyridium curvatum TaxID=1093900 RepID=A0A507B9J2_9PEZI|nr:uncharacterized protein E0L32_000170 [Thyridium curvatum]TPX15836.1 hypothetical protein E0L32_000170 [Thyridium curvatum]
MSGVIEALHIYDERNTPILSHTYTGRPLSAAHLLPLYLEHPTPRPNLIYLSTTNPPTLVFSLSHANLLFLLTTSSEIEPLLVLEFLHRVVDALEEFLGAPLLPSKIESNYDIVAQLLTELCDAGTVATTEPNALRDLVEVEGFMGKLLGSITLPGAINKPLGGGGIGGGPASGSNAPSSLMLSQNMPALPWRRANVRHTSNEMYADVVETLSVTLAPSGRPIAAFAHGTIAFTSKVSGVPDIVLSLTSPAGRHNLGSIMELPVFHPCVRLARWKEQPGELSFVPPDGRFILAGYEVDLLPFSNGKSGNMAANNLQLPVNIEMKTGLGPAGSDFEARVHISRTFTSSMSGSGAGGVGGGPAGRGFGGGPHAGTLGAPLLEDVKIVIPLPAEVRNLSEIRPSKGDATYNPGDQFLEWHISNKDLAAGATYFGLRCTVVGRQSASDEDDDDAVADDPMGFRAGGGFREYEAYQADEKPHGDDGKKKTALNKDSSAAAAGNEKLVQQNRMLMPSSASVSFGVKGWLPSGIKIESIVLDPKRSRGLGESVKPYKGVKYLTISKGGVEVRC